MTETAVLEEPVDMRLSLARTLVTCLEQGKNDEVDEIINNLVHQQESVLFQEIGKLTRQLHDAMAMFRDDDRIAEIAEEHFPDARERLNYVIDKTEESAHRTLSAVEQALPIASELEEKGTAMHADWKRFTRREMNVDEFKQMSSRIDSFLESVEDDARLLNGKLSDIMMAQDFQDLTGQIIRQVIKLVQDMEQGLVGVIKKSGRTHGHEEQKKRDVVAEGPQINSQDTPGVMSGQDDVDDLLSSLGF